MQSLPKVLVVDDDQNILSAFEDFLRKERCAMIAASSAEEAVEKVRHEPVDLLITDIRLKCQSGVTFFMHMKANQPDLRIIVITGYPDLISGEDVKLFGADYFFLKPLELNKLRGAVRACLNLDRSETSRKKGRRKRIMIFHTHKNHNLHQPLASGD
jgi:DNA-binding NtrC family response regulator